MPFNRPTLPALIERATTDVESRLPGATARRPSGNLYVLARVHAGAVHGLYGYLQWISQQLPDRADEDMLARWCDIFGVTPTPAGFAAARLDVVGNSGSRIPAGTRWQRADGRAYVSQTEVAIAAGAAIVDVVAEQSGVGGSLIAAETLSLINPVVGVETAATVRPDGLVSGADAQTLNAVRADLIARIQQPGHGGAKHDYVTWANEVPGVTRVWTFANWLGDGNVGVFFVRDNDPEGLIPSAAEVAAVAAHLEPLKPVTAHLIVSAPTPVALNLTLRLSPDTPALRAAVTESVKKLLAVEAVPGGTIRLSHIREAISDTPGEADHVLLAPAGDVAVMQNEIAIMGEITWI